MFGNSDCGAYKIETPSLSEYAFHRGKLLRYWGNGFRQASELEHTMFHDRDYVMRCDIESGNGNLSFVSAINEFRRKEISGEL
jgi:hypothetical protein